MKALCIVLLILALTASAASGAWVTELIARGKVGAACSLAVDAKGEPSCVYLAKAGRYDNVMLARRTGGEWKFEVLAEGVKVTGATAVTHDDSDWDYVAFPVDGGGKLICVHETAGGWITETVASGKALGRDISFAQWPNGHRDLAYSYLSDLNVRLNYAHFDDNQWDIFTVVTSGSAGSDNSLFFDAAKRPNIVYHDVANTTLMHAVSIDGQDWDTVKIGDGKDCDAFATPDGRIHASFVSADNAKLYYVRHDNTGWDKPQEIGNVVGLPGHTRVAVNGLGDIFIAYVDVGKKSGLHMMTLKGEVWQHEVVYDVKFKDPYYDMAIAKEEYPLLCFSNGTGRGLRLAWYDDSSEFPRDGSGEADDGTPARTASLTLRPVAPNPVTGAATLSFELAEAASVRLVVYDAAGRKVATAAEGHYAAGVHDVPFRAGLAPGVYVYRLEAGGEAAARKMVVAE